MSQIPAGAEGTVAAVMLYCCVCLIASSLMVWLTWTHHERTSHVAILSYFATLSIIASLVQQAYDVVRYRDLVKEQYENRKQHPGSPEIAIANASVGFSLVLYYIQYYCYNVEAMSVMFWASYLAQSVYGLTSRPKLKVFLRRFNRGGKALSILFPLTTILLLRVPQIHDTFVVFILLADLPLMLSLFFGCVLMVLILARYVYTKRKFSHWTADTPSDNIGDSSTLESGSAKSPAPGTIGSSRTPTTRARNQGIWDRWLMVRFTIAFISLSVFEVTNTLFQLMAVANAQSDYDAPEPEISADRAKESWLFFMPGVTPGLFIFIVFGTTKPLRRYMYETFVPSRWQKKPAPITTTEEEVTNCWRRRSDIGPTPPPKDHPPRIGSETHDYVQERTFKERSRPGPSPVSHCQLAEPDRSESDELPMLPIMRHDGRYVRRT